MDRIFRDFPWVCVFIDDVTIKGMADDWEQLWDRTCLALVALAEAGFMVNLRKTKFLTQQAKLLGVQVQPAGYYLGSKCLKGWADLRIPTT